MKYRLPLLILLLCWGLFFSIPAWSQQDTIIPGVTFNGTPLGGLGYGQVMIILEKKEKEIMQKKIFFKLPEGRGDVISFTYHELGVGLDKEKIWDEGFSLGRKGKWWQRFLIRWQVKKRGQEIPRYLKIDGQKAEQSLLLQGRPWEKDAQEARFMISSDDRVNILPEVYGQALDLDRIMRELENKLIVSKDQDLWLELYFKVIKPPRTKTDLEAYAVKGLAAKFTTQFNPGQINRTRNIRRAISALDGYLLEPEGIFSFNQVVGPRTKEKGYDEADTILNNEVVPGVGGGVCQVSTTLYNAVLRARLEVIERYPHSIMIRYVEPGRDAAVAYGSKDLRFCNNTGGYLLFKANVNGDSLSLKIYGQPDPNKRVAIKSIKEKEITPPIIFKEEPKVPLGQFILEKEGSPGYIIRVERYIYDQEGKMLRSETISRDTYSPIPRVIMTSSSLLSN